MFKVKEEQNGRKRYKARLVVKGFQQKRGEPSYVGALNDTSTQHKSEGFQLAGQKENLECRFLTQEGERKSIRIKLVTLPHELGIGRRNCLFISKKLRANKRESRSIVLRFQGFNAEGKTSYGDQYLHMGNDSIMYAVRCTRPRFCGVCSNLGQSVFKNRGQSTGFAVKHFYKYLRNTKDYVFSIWRISRYRKLDVTGAVDWMKVQEADYHCDACDPIEYMALLPSEACNGISSLDRSSFFRLCRDVTQIEGNFVWTDSSTKAMIKDRFSEKQVLGYVLTVGVTTVEWESRLQKSITIRASIVRILISERSLSLLKILGTKSLAVMFTRERGYSQFNDVSSGYLDTLYRKSPSPAFGWCSVFRMFNSTERLEQ
ncbi:hypothetical protein Tco_0858703 [Tanacetum coccineum]|uniref:Uncharacterized protein n=1 Tax=Tanacetum coccineum TaxID=301880 RepID=A0ABQ5B9V9_9ASTR